MTLSIAEEVDGCSQLVWERLMAKTRYGRYADAVESKMVFYALDRQRTPGTLLDIGCEGGRWSKLFADRGWQVTALDIDAEVLRICKERIKTACCTLVTPNEQRFPVPDESVDIALCIEVGPVIHRPWAIGEFARALKRGGRLVGVCWNRSSWRGVLYHSAPALRTTGSDPLVGFPIRYLDFKTRMQEHGFRFERESGYAWGPFRRTSNSPWMSMWAAVETYTGLQSLIRFSPMVAFACQKL